MCDTGNGRCSPRSKPNQCLSIVTRNARTELDATHSFYKEMHIKVLFSSEKIYKIDTVAFSFVFDKYCPIMD